MRSGQAEKRRIQNEESDPVLTTVTMISSQWYEMASNEAF